MYCNTERDPDESFESMVASPARAYREHYIFGRNELPGNCAKGCVCHWKR